MTAAALRKQINQVVKRLPDDRLDALAKIVMYLDQPTILERLEKSKREFAQGKGTNWRKIRKDV